MDWKDVGGAVLKAAPMLGSLIGGPAGAAVGVAAKIAAEALGVDSTPDAIAQAIQTDPTAALKLREAELSHAERLQELANAARKQEIDAAISGKQAELDELRTTLADIQDARKTHATDRHVFWLGISVLIVFLIIAVLVLVGVGALLTGGLSVQDAGLLATATGIVGTLIGYQANNASQVITFYFGSSKGSSDKTTALANAVKQVAAK